jgi:hypothetical protein
MTYELDSSVSLTLSHEWDQASNVRQSVDASIPFTHHDLKDAIIMTASELVENAIKHGMHGPGNPPATFSMNVDRASVIIVVSNGVRPAKAAKLIARIDRIMAAEDRGALYMERMSELISQKSAHGGLGLYRIAFEGGFDLHVQLSREPGETQDGIVTVRATRRLR